MSVIKFIVKNSLPEVACKKVLISFKTLNEINFESKSLKNYKLHIYISGNLDNRKIFRLKVQNIKEEEKSIFI